MMLLRYIARAVVVPALLAGCTQSLFDNGAGGDGDRRDGAPRPDARTGDGGMPGRTDGGGAGDPDGGRSPDAGPPRPTCPEPCQGDAFGDYNNQQGGSNSRWKYVEYRPDQPENEFSVMPPDVVVGWKGSGLMPPTVTYCSTMEPDPPCAGLFQTLALTSMNGAPEAHHPGLMWTAQEAGTYRISGTWQVASTAPPVPVIMKVARNTQSDVVHAETLTLTAAPYAFETETDLAVDEFIVLTAATTDTPMSVGVNLFITGPITATNAGAW